MPSDKEKLEKRREQKKLSMRRAREKLKQDRDKHEEIKQKDRERYRKKKEEGLVMGIKDLSRRDQKAKRKEWREKAKRYRQKEKNNRLLNDMLQRNSPLPTPEREIELPSTPPSTSRIASGKKIARRNREKWKKEKNDLIKMLDEAKSRKNKYKTRYYRLKKIMVKKMSTPEKTVSEMIAGQSVTPTVRKNLLHGKVLKKQISKKETKTIFKKVLHGPLIKKFKLNKMLQNLTSRRTLSYRKQVTNGKIIAARRAVVEFLEEDENSRITAGKKEKITRKKVKKQIRYLNDSMRRLHEKFIKNTQLKKITYSTFCSLRPFWIKFPNYKSRSTCLCKIHTNMVKRCKIDQLLCTNFPYELSKSLCCEIYREEWQEKMCHKTLKESIPCTKLELVKELNNTIGPYMKHCLTVSHQQKAITDIKQNLTSEEILIHVDFSENYECKYGEEIQSVHFGGSKQQISLQTVVVYYHEGHQCFCTLSENLKHDPLAICAHFEPNLNTVKTIVPGLKTAYCLSDGPSNTKIKQCFNWLSSMWRIILMWRHFIGIIVPVVMARERRMVLEGV
ncbi:unnamed protein product [Brassicogethes aeneus]|uniref:Uncharacterized protein n=1 Tax=Brassicogethes aeneus TaxID=1431903 RepID=A0A9P0FMF5_BRAAE|nr:unnamed protein product [Brassicogethes aeneus]